METYQHIKDILYNCHADVARRKKNIVLPLLVTLAGLAVTFWSLTDPAVGENANLAAGLLFGGVILALSGLVWTLRAATGSTPVYAPTGEKLRHSERFYDLKDKRKLCAALESGSPEQLAGLAHSDSSGVVLTLYTTATGSFALAQVAEYIPHRFVPITAVIPFGEGHAQAILALA